MKSFFSIESRWYSHHQLLLIVSLLFYSYAFGQRQEPQTIHCDADSLMVLNDQVLIFIKQGVYQKAKLKTIKSQFGDVCSSKLLASDGFEIGKSASLYFFKSDIAFPDNYDYGLAVWKIIEPIVARIPNGTWVESGWRYLNWGKSLYFVRVSTKNKSYQFGFFNIDGKLAFSLFQCQRLELSSAGSLAAIAANLQLTKPDSYQSRYLVNQ